MKPEVFNALGEMDNHLKQEMQEEQEMIIHPEQYVMQTLDDAALCLTVCRMALDKMSTMIPSDVIEVEKRVSHLKDMLQSIDESVAQWYTYGSTVDSSLEGN